MIVVAGGTGTVGRAVVSGLAGAGHQVRALSRRPGPDGGAWTGRPVSIVGVDLADRAALRTALEGAHAVFAVLADPLRPEQGRNLVAAAREAGVRRMVRLSAMAVGDGGDDLITGWHRSGEEELRASGLEWTVLRPRAFMSNTLGWADRIRTEGVVSAVHGRAANACVDPADIAEVAVRTLTEPGHHGQVYGLTGPAAISPMEQTEVLSELLGRRLEFREPSPAEARARLLRRYPAPVVDALTRSAERLAAGAKTQVHPTVRRLTGRPPRSYRDWAAAHLHHFG